MQEKLVSRAKELLSDGTVVRVLGWRKGDTDFSAEPAFFETAESLSEFTYDGFCGANLSKYMIKASKEEGKTLVFLKPCDTYSFNQLSKSIVWIARKPISSASAAMENSISKRSVKQDARVLPL